LSVIERRHPQLHKYEVVLETSEVQNLAGISGYAVSRYNYSDEKGKSYQNNIKHLVCLAA